MMRKLLTNLDSTTYNYLKGDLLSAKKIWNQLKPNPQDVKVSVDSLKSFVRNNQADALPKTKKSVEEFKIPQSGCTKPSHKKSQYSVSNLLRESKPTAPQKQIAHKRVKTYKDFSKININSRVEEMIKKKQDYYLKLEEKKRESEESTLKE